MPPLPPLFDVNGAFGCGAFARPDFPEAADLLAHMDRLGVARALAWHAQARDLNPSVGNPKLLQAIEETDGAADRLVPSFVIYPPMFFELGAMDCLLGALESGRVRAVRAFQATSRFDLPELERVLKEIARFDPALIWDVRDRRGPQDYRELVALAERFPAVRFVCAQAMWPQMNPLLDMMWRRANILTDTSWLHVRGDIELVVKQFGADRIVFGTGPKAHGGAAIAALAHAQISDEARERIAHRNLEGLLSMGPVEAPPARPARADKPLWDAFRGGAAVADVDVIDAHGHLGPAVAGYVIEESGYAEQLPGMAKQMDRLGVGRMIASSQDALFGHCVEGNRILADEAAPFGDRFLGYVSYNPLYAEELDRRLDEFFSGAFFVGFKLLCDYWRVPVTDERFASVWEYANARRLPILLHTWQGPHDSPAMLRDIAPAYPDAVFLLGHSGGGDAGRREAVDLAAENSNVYLEFCGSFTSAILWEDTLARVGADRYVFGTDAAFHNPAWEMGRLLSLDAPDAELVPILGANMRGILSRRR